MDTIEYKTGDMFEEPTEAIVNTVNCVGVMGKGIALEFRRRWPENYRAYKKLCDAKQLMPGRMFVFDNHDLFSDGKHKYLINFPTKQHWRSKSKIEYIRDGLDDLVRQLRILEIASVALPQLGCGNGGLEWSEVRPLIEERLAELPEVRFVVFAPEPDNLGHEHDVPPRSLTTGRATMMVVFAELEKYFGGCLTGLSAQKLAYFLQAFGADMSLKFSKRQFGPYSETLHDAFREMENKRYIYGYTEDKTQIFVTPATHAALEEYLRSKGVDVSELVSKLSLLIEGYETPYGMELLSSVHLLSVTERITTQPEMSEALEAWNDKNRQSFPESAVAAALERLKADGLIVANPS